MADKIWLCDGDCYLNDNGELVTIHRDDDASNPRKDFDNPTHFYTWDNDHYYHWNNTPSPDNDGHGNAPEDMRDLLLAIVDENQIYDEEDQWDGESEHPHQWMFDIMGYGNANMKEYIPQLVKLMNDSGRYVARGLAVSGSADYGSLRYHICESDCDGLIYVEKEELARIWGTPLDRIDDVFESEFNIYSAWCNGECYGFTTVDKFGNDVDSCWGFYGDDAIESGLATECGGLNRCDFKCTDDFYQAHEDDPDVLIENYNSMRACRDRMTDWLHDKLSYIVNDRKIDVRFDGDTLVLA